MNYAEEIQKIIREHRGHIYDYGQAGFIVCDQTGRHILHVDNIKANFDIKPVFGLLDHFFSTQSPVVVDEHFVDKYYTFIFDIDCKFLQDTGERRKIAAVLKEKSTLYCMLLRLYFDRSNEDALSSIECFLEDMSKSIQKDRYRVQIHGFFPKMNMGQKNYFYSNSTQFFFECSTAEVFNTEVQDSILDMAEYGFRVPYVLHVNSENVNDIHSLIPNILTTNFNAGFSLPLSCENFFPSKISNPSRTDYLSLLVKFYRNYPFFDDVFYPMNVAMSGAVSNVFYHEILHKWDETLIKVNLHPDVLWIQKKIIHTFMWMRWKIHSAIILNALENSSLF